MEWVAFAQLEPFGFHADWAPFAHLLAMLANIHRNPKKARKYKAEDFMPKEVGLTSEEPWEDMLQQFAHMTAVMGGSVKKEPS